jgi:midasin (ATPase involved in ribosome maturation)
MVRHAKPILMEGSPGVGKTTLVTALARALGKPLTRINLQEQIARLGSFHPAEPSHHAAWLVGMVRHAK